MGKLTPDDKLSLVREMTYNFNKMVALLARCYGITQSEIRNLFLELVKEQISEVDDA